MESTENEGRKKVSGEEGEREDTSSRSILGQFQTVIKTAPNGISKCGQRHCNPYALVYSYTKFRIDKSKQR